MHLKYKYNLSVLEAENEISYYLLGAFITDGCVYKNGTNNYACQLSSIDQDWLTNISQIIGENLKLHKFKENYYGIRITQNKIAQWFINHGCLPNKTYTITLPNIPNEYFKDFLRGCIDGDGTIGSYKSKKNCQLISANQFFLQQIQEILKSYSIYGAITNRGMKNSIIGNKKVIATVNSHSLNFSGRNCYKLLQFIYYPNHKISMLRKYKLAQQIIDYYSNLPIDDLRKIPKLNKTCKIEWPTDTELITMIKQSGYTLIAKQLGVHHTSIRNRLKRRNLY